MIQRRQLPTLIAAAALLPRMASAQDTTKAASFVKSAGDRLVAVVNGPGNAAAKRADMTKIINQVVDVDGVGKFCLGRYWRTATPDQQKRYLELFHEVLVTSITAKLGEYQGVAFQMGRAAARDDGVTVSTTVVRPNNPPTSVDWIIQDVEGAPKIIDVVAEGTSLRLTQRSDYASYLTHNNSNLDALIGAMKSQVAQTG